MAYVGIGLLALGLIASSYAIYSGQFDSYVQANNHTLSDVYNDISVIDDVAYYGTLAYSMIHGFADSYATENNLSTTPTDFNTYDGVPLNCLMSSCTINGIYIFLNHWQNSNDDYPWSQFKYTLSNGQTWSTGGVLGLATSFYVTISSSNYVDCIATTNLNNTVTYGLGLADSSKIGFSSVSTSSDFSSNLSSYPSSSAYWISTNSDTLTYDTSATYSISATYPSANPSPSVPPVVPPDYNFTVTDGTNTYTGSYSSDYIESLNDIDLNLDNISEKNDSIFDLLSSFFSNIWDWLSDFFDNLTDSIESIFSTTETVSEIPISTPVIPTPSPTPNNSDGSSFHGGWLKGILQKLGILSILSHLSAPWGIVTEWITSISSFLSWFGSFLVSCPRIFVLPFYGSLCMFAILVFIKRFIG